MAEPTTEVRHLSKTEKINLSIPMRTNDTVYPRGEQEVSHVVAEDLKRREKTYQEYQASLHKDNGRDSNMGSISGGE